VHPRNPYLAWCLLIALGFTGCAIGRFRAVEQMPDGTKHVTSATLFQFWDSRMRFDKLRTSSTDKTQGVTLGGYDDTVSSTNVAEVVAKAVEAAIKGMKGIP
jgi:hypothetical protein